MIFVVDFGKNDSELSVMLATETYSNSAINNDASKGIL